METQTDAKIKAHGFDLHKVEIELLWEYGRKAKPREIRNLKSYLHVIPCHYKVKGGSLSPSFSPSLHAKSLSPFLLHYILFSSVTCERISRCATSKPHTILSEVLTCKEVRAQNTLFWYYLSETKEYSENSVK